MSPGADCHILFRYTSDRRSKLEDQMDTGSKPDWVLLEYDSDEILEKSLVDRGSRTIFFPAVGRMRTDEPVDIRIVVGESNVIFPMRASVVEVRERPQGPNLPRGVFLEVIKDDQGRFDRLCAYADGVWRPSARRAHPRYPASYRVSYRYPKDKFPGETLDLSVKGMFVRTEGLLPESGIELQVKLSPGRLRSSIALNCQVRWVDRVEGRRGMGLLCKGPADGLERLAELVSKIVQTTKA